MRISDWSSDVCSSDLGIPELKQVYTAVGSVLDVGDPSKSGVGEPRKATLILDWGKPEDRESDQKTLERVARDRLADLPGVSVNYISSEPGELQPLGLAGARTSGGRGKGGTGGGE